MLLSRGAHRPRFSPSILPCRVTAPCPPQELVHGQPGEEAVQHGMTEKQRRLMESHLHPGTAPSGGQGPAPHVAAEVCEGVAGWGRGLPGSGCLPLRCQELVPL